jgi:hypothetical protein
MRTLLVEGGYRRRNVYVVLIPATDINVQSEKYSG